MYGSQATAAPESILADACHAVGYGDGGQAAAVIESTLADACHVFPKNVLFYGSSPNCVGKFI